MSSLEGSRNRFKVKILEGFLHSFESKGMARFMKKLTRQSRVSIRKEAGKHTHPFRRFVYMCYMSLQYITFVSKSVAPTDNGGSRILSSNCLDEQRSFQRNCCHQDAAREQREIEVLRKEAARMAGFVKL